MSLYRKKGKMRPIFCLSILASYLVYSISTDSTFALAIATPPPKSFSQSSVRKAQCLRFRETDVLRDLCPAFQQSDLDSFEALFPDVSILSGLGHDADMNLLYGSQAFHESDRHDGNSIRPDDQRDPATSTEAHDAAAATAMATPTARKEQLMPPGLASASSPPSMQYDTSSSMTKDGPLFSYKEWEQKHTPPKESDRRSPRKKAAGSGGDGSGGGRQMIDSVDGVFADDFGSMFEAAGRGESPTVANVYNENEYIEPSRSGAPSKLPDLPIKSFKERFNYASIDCAATVRGANKEARGAQSILYESKDQYMLSKCSADKYVIINLCEEILIDTIVLANFEFFSSTFKDFRVYVADQYPTNDWKFLGQWQARNTRDLQVFKVTNRIGWFENIKIEFLTHYGHEYYCPLSLVRVHGMPMWEYYNLIESRDLSGDLDEDALMERYLWPSEVRDEIIHPKIDVSNDTISMPENREDERQGQVPIIPPLPNDQNIPPAHPEDLLLPPVVVVVPEANVGVIEPGESSSGSIPVVTHPSSDETAIIMEGPAVPPADSAPDHLEQDNLSTTPDSISGVCAENQEDEGRQQQQPQHPSTATAAIHDGSENAVHLDQSTPSFGIDTASDTPMIVPDSQQQHSATTVEVSAGSAFIGPLPSASETPVVTSSPPPPPPSPNLGPDDVVTRAIPIPKMPHKDGNTQESIYKTIMKRLNALEANVTLSQRYLDEQNQILNDVLRNMEKRHQDQLIALLGRLNDTASSRIDSMRQRYEQLYEELKYESEHRAQEAAMKMSQLADQIAFERRVSMAQLVVVLTLFVFVALSRGTLSILSPIMEAQAQERKRRESADAVAPASSPSPLPLVKSSREIHPAITATMESSPVSPPTDEEDDERVVKDFCTARRSSSAEPIRRWSNESESTSEPTPHAAVVPEHRFSSTGDDTAVPYS
ncbi:UNC-like C-terminal-domain-containing protein [Dichotomocladium elegans]|nr:UNC-like C-terminal-domain-containing protein [Dichotomocladium elegans]